MAVVFSRKPSLASIPSERCTCILVNGWSGCKGYWAANGLCIHEWAVCVSERHTEGPLIVHRGYAEAVNGKGLIVTVISVGVALGGLILNGQHTLEAAIASNREAIAVLQEDVSGLRERMARLEDLFKGHVKGDCSE